MTASFSRSSQNTISISKTKRQKNIPLQKQSKFQNKKGLVESAEALFCMPI